MFVCHFEIPSIEVARGLRAKFAGVYENRKSLLVRETAHNPNLRERLVY